MHIIVFACVLASEWEREHSACICDSANFFAHGSIVSTVHYLEIGICNAGFIYCMCRWGHPLSLEC